jgi:hypothetical protein
LDNYATVKSVSTSFSQVESALSSKANVTDLNSVASKVVSELQKNMDIKVLELQGLLSEKLLHKADKIDTLAVAESLEGINEKLLTKVCNREFKGLQNDCENMKQLISSCCRSSDLVRLQNQMETSADNMLVELRNVQDKCMSKFEKSESEILARALTSSVSSGLQRLDFRLSQVEKSVSSGSLESDTRSSLNRLQASLETLASKSWTEDFIISKVKECPSKDEVHRLVDGLVEKNHSQEGLLEKLNGAIGTIRDQITNGTLFSQLHSDQIKSLASKCAEVSSRLDGSEAAMLQVSDKQHKVVSDISSKQSLLQSELNALSQIIKTKVDSNAMDLEINSLKDMVRKWLQNFVAESNSPFP